MEMETIGQRKIDEVKLQHANELSNLKASLTSELIERYRYHKQKFDTFQRQIDY